MLVAEQVEQAEPGSNRGLKLLLIMIPKIPPCCTITCTV